MIRSLPRDRVVLVPGGFVGAVINQQGSLPRLRLLVMRARRSAPANGAALLPGLRFAPPAGGGVRVARRPPPS